MANKNIGDLPEGMVSEILVRLPVKTLLICKSVCKPWLSTISNPHFVKSQLRRAIIASMNTPTLLTIQNPPPTAEELAFQMNFEMKALEMESHFEVVYTSPDHESQQHRRRQLIDQALLDTNAQDLSASPVHFDRLVIPRLFHPGHRIIGVCNGIICLANGFGNDVYLWNPSIRKCKKLPAPEPYTTRSYPVKVGFGYDSVSNDYKVLRIVSDEKETDVVPIVQVYSSNADSWTTEFEARILQNCRLYEKSNVVVNGVLYFDAFLDSGSNELISFDLHQETFGLVSFPSFSTRKGSDVLDFQGSVAMIFQSGPEIDLWTLDNVSREVSWSKKFSIEADSETRIWLSKCLGAGQFFGQKLFNESFFMFNVLYDCEKKEIKIYKPQEENVCAYLKYTETLVSLDGFEQVQ